MKSVMAEKKPVIKYVELHDEVKLHYAEQGDRTGVPVLLLPGGFDSWRSFALVLPHLPASMRVFALSQRGHGDSSKPETGYRSRQLAADVAAFMEALDLAAAVIAGHSSSSLVAQRFVLDYPERALGLVLIAPFATMRDKPVAREARAATAELTDPVDPAFVHGFQQSTVAQQVPEAFFDTIVQESSKVPARVWRALSTGVSEEDSLRELHKIEAPTLIVWGARDGATPRSDQEALVAGIANSRLVVYPDAGHAIHWEEPERFASDLAAFVETLPS